MKAIPVTEKTLRLLKKGTSRHLFRRIRNAMDIGESVGKKIFYIPEYNFPEAAGIPRRDVVDDAFLHQWFDVPSCTDDMLWISITPKRVPSANDQALQELGAKHVFQDSIESNGHGRGRSRESSLSWASGENSNEPSGFPAKGNSRPDARRQRIRRERFRC